MINNSKSRLIEVVPYDNKWPLLFAEEESILKKILGKNCVDIHHIGSTSVPGLAAKPVIDILVVVSMINQVDTINALMLERGYKAQGENGMPFRRFFQKGGAKDASCACI